MDNQLARVMEQLIRDRRLTKKDLQKAVDQGAKDGRALEQVLVETGKVSREHYLEALATVSGVPSIDVRHSKIHYSTAQVVPQSMAQRFKMLCIGREKDRIVVAMLDPHDTFALEYARMRTGFEVEPRGAFLPDLLQAIERAYSVTVNRIDAETPVGEAAKEGNGGNGGEGTRFVVASPTPARARKSEILWRDVAAQQPPRVIPLSGRMPVLPPEADEALALRALVEIGADLSATLDLESLVAKILQVGLDLSNSEACSLIMISEEGNSLYFRGAIGARAEEVCHVRFPLDEHSVAGYAIKHRKSMRINDVAQDPRHNKDVDKAVDFRTASLMAVPVMWMGEPLGVLEAVNKRERLQYTEKDQRYFEILAGQAAVALNNSVLVSRLQNFYSEAVELLIDTLEVHDGISRSHLVEVARFAAEMARFLNLSKPELERLTYAGLLHDVGKIRVENPEDPAHAAAGAQILARVRIFEDVAPIVRHHHERFDGNGFPDGLKGEEIPRLARLLALAEAWVEGLARVGPEGRVRFLEEIRSRFRTWFDPDLRQAFEAAVETLGTGRPAAPEPV